MNSAIFKRTSFIQTKHQVNFQYVMSVNWNMLQEGWEPDHITVNQMYNKAIQQLDNRKFSYSQRWQVYQRKLSHKLWKKHLVNCR